MKLIKKLAIMCLASLALLGMMVQAAEPRISVQLWSVKDQISEDFEGTLKKLAAMGFDGVEFARNFGPYANNPAGLKAFLAEIGLEASGAHVGTDDIAPGKIHQTIAFYKTLGADHIVVPYDERAFDAKGIDKLIAELNTAAKTLEGYGMQTGYHNHAQEFGDFKGATYWDYLAKNTSDKVILQLDVGWATVAGKDPIAFVESYPGRTLSTHIKASLPEGTEGKRQILGDDVTDWNAVISAMKKSGGTQWLVLEQEEYPDGLTPMQAVEKSMQGLQTILADM
ncbi:MAG TPA: sugar phosphate isomerase/epimerase [Cellvibrionaceae bacterium]